MADWEIRRRQGGIQGELSDDELEKSVIQSIEHILSDAGDD